MELKAELKGISSPLKKVCPTEPIKLAAKTQNKFSLTSIFTLLPSKFIAKSITWTENGRKQKRTLLIVTLDDVTEVIKQIYNILLFSIKPLGGLFMLSEGGFPTMAYTRRLRRPNGDTSLSLQVLSVLTHVAIIYANVLEQKKVFA